MLAITPRLKERVKRYRKEHRHRVDRLSSSPLAEPVGSALKDGCVVREPSLVELAERYPAKHR